MKPKRKLTLTIGDAAFVTGFDAKAAAPPKVKPLFKQLRHCLGQKPIPIKQCFSLVDQIPFDAQTAKRCRAYLHEIERGNRAVMSNLKGLLNKEEDSMRARFRRKGILRKNASAMPQLFNGKVPNVSAKIYRGNQARKPGSHES